MNLPPELQNMDKLMKGRYNALMIEKVIDMCF
jgi:hypothetical protein